MEIELDFSDVPGDVAMAITEMDEVNVVAARLARSLGLDDADRQMLQAELIGETAALADRYSSS